ncbi:MAG: 2-amino-4-hydroxy-6-hydroxymethyldihydropteridine diphosphokinase [Alysiella sp.]|uniref:2-amino-4-hydroxy-6- hydroxymethyldihydropteridine diphosphokinase n=1 Tax=Alysiella sp. TaxID=1872483 RepID=UPI0026DD497D|nr:2-amino-4-hydroxy-6-hydroxymethyldihydropteridine diphosphokinase [Alysiella sp.]MDO4434218.1 2-amino-4-hydroxy-6-hydroxymethyldihydropteridine diphosphokinase [Alysiella sp.]
MSEFHTAVIAFGSNLANPAQQVEKAAQAVASLPEILSLTLSPLYLSKPFGYAEQPDFVNAVAVLHIQKSMTPVQFLSKLQEIENEFGRVRTFRNAPRTLDLDIIDFNHQCLDSPNLILPHPRAHERSFVMLPLSQIAPNYPIGKHGTAQELAMKLGNSGIAVLPFQTA